MEDNEEFAVKLPGSPAKNENYFNHEDKNSGHPRLHRESFDGFRCCESSRILNSVAECRLQGDKARSVAFQFV
jgi:hypothetical protein